MKARIILIAAMMTIVLTAAAMPYTEARSKAMFLSDKMAYELNLTESQFDAVYEINLDYMLNLEEESDMTGYIWKIRNRDMGFVLTDAQYDQYHSSEWLYIPFTMNTDGCTLLASKRYSEGQFLMQQPDVFLSYKGGHCQTDDSFYADQQFEEPYPPKYLGQAD